MLEDTNSLDGAQLMKMSKFPKYLWILPPTTLPTPVTENTSLIWKNNNESKQRGKIIYR